MTRPRRRHLPVAGLLLLCACAGSPTGGNAPLRSGVYPLRAYNGDALPADQGPMPPKGNNTGACALLVSSGSLRLTLEQHTFSYQYQYQNGCTLELMSEITLSGAVDQSGGGLVFRVTRVDGEVRFTGSVEAQAIVVRNGDEVLEFAR